MGLSKRIALSLGAILVSFLFALLFFSWSTGDVIPPGVDQHSLSFQTLTSMLPGQN